MEDVKFFKHELPKIDGCIDDFSVKEILTKAKESTIEHFVFYLILVGC